MVKLYSAKTSIKAIRRGEQVWFMILCAIDTACPYKVDSMQGNGTVVHDQPNNPTLVSKWQALWTEYADVFEQPREHVSRLVDHRIYLIGPNAMPPKLRLYRMLEDELKAVKEMIDDYLSRGWIRPITGSYGAPVIVIWKETRELCIVLDYQLLNQQTRLNLYPTPCINELLDRLACAKYFNKID